MKEVVVPLILPISVQQADCVPFGWAPVLRSSTMTLQIWSPSRGVAHCSSGISKGGGGECGGCDGGFGDGGSGEGGGGKRGGGQRAVERGGGGREEAAMAAELNSAFLRQQNRDGHSY